MRTHLIILLAFSLLALLLTWPTVTHVASHLPGDGGDDPAIAWNLWWAKHALLTLRTNPLFSDYMFYPIGVNLAFYTLTLLNALTALPLTLTLGVVTASNIHMWFTFVVGGYGAFLLARQVLGSGDQGIRESGNQGVRESGNQESGNRVASLPHSLTPWAAGMAGGFYAFASSQLFYVSLGQFNIASSHWVPYAILFVIKSRRDLSSLRWPALAALFLTMQAWAEMTYASFALVFIALYVAYEIVRNIKYQISNIPGLPAACPSWLRHAGQGACAPGAPSRHGAGRTGKYQIAFAFRNLLVLGFLFALGISPVLAAMLPDMRAEGDFFLQGSGFAEFFSADLLGFLVPTMRHPLLGEWVSRTGILNFDKGQHIYLGFTLLILAAVGVKARVRAAGRSPVRGRPQGASLHRRGPGVWFWLIAALFFAWLTLGPTIHVNGTDTGIPGPFVILQSLPFFKGNRYPGRYSVMLALSLAMLAAMGIEAIWRKVSKRRILFPALCCLLSAAFAFEHLSTPLPQSDMRVPAPYEVIAAEPDQFALLDIPLAWRNGFRITGPIHPGFMFGQFYQTAHGRQLLQGNTSRNPEFKFQYFTEAPVINSILALETGHELAPEHWGADQAVAGDVLRFFDIRYIVVRPGPGTDPSVTPEATLPYIQEVMPVEQIHSDPTLTLYRVNLPPYPERVEVSASAPLARLYFGEGWGTVADKLSEETDQLVWAQRRTARLFVPLKGGSQQVTLRLFVAGEDQSMRISTGGWRSAPLPLRPGWGEYALTLPAEAVHTGLNEVRLHFDWLYPVASLADGEGRVLSRRDASRSIAEGRTADGRANTPPAAILVQSAGQEVGDFAHIYVNGVDVSSNERGYNVAVLDPQGDVQTANFVPRTGHFDTHLDPGASAALATFIAAVPEGHIVAVAAADEASMNLDEDAVIALHAIGAAGDLRGKFRWSHAVIGVKGAEPGSALEAMDSLRPVGVAIGPAVTEPTVAAAVAWIRFEATSSK